MRVDDLMAERFEAYWSRRPLGAPETRWPLVAAGAGIATALLVALVVIVAVAS